MVAALEFENLTKEYRSFASRRRLRALDGFSLQVETGEIFGFLGPNGAGKSTAIHLAMGFMRPTSGSGRMLGQPFGYARARRRVGFLAENVALYHRRAESLVRFYGALNGMRGSYLAKRAREALAAVGLQEQANRNVGKFSRGMLQRVGLAQALVNDPDLLILDEPTSALDPLARVAVRDLLLSSEQTEIVARGIAANAFAGAVAQDSVVRFTVESSKQRVALENVWHLGGEILSVNPVRRSLEDIFLEVTAGQESTTGGAQ